MPWIKLEPSIVPLDLCAFFHSACVCGEVLTRWGLEQGGGGGGANDGGGSGLVSTTTVGLSLRCRFSCLPCNVQAMHDDVF